MRHAFVVPAYGDSPYLGECVASLANQTRRGSIVAIATSTPSAYIERVAIEHGVPLAINPRRAGIGADWNFALDATDADLVTVAHQDDTYRADYLERVLRAMSRHPDASIAFTDYVEQEPAGTRPIHVNIRVKRLLTRRVFRNREAIETTSDKRRLLAWGNPVCCPSVVLRRARLPGFRFTESMYSNLDWDAWLRLADSPGAFVYVREPLVVRRIHERSETSALIADKRRLDEDRAMFDRFWPAPIAAAITSVYRASYLANRT
jgi:glycosyltransferase involved in cell wall biosynthesis